MASAKLTAVVTFGVESRLVEVCLALAIIVLSFSEPLTDRFLPQVIVGPTNGGRMYMGENPEHMYPIWLGGTPSGGGTACSGYALMTCMDNNTRFADGTTLNMNDGGRGLKWRGPSPNIPAAFSYGQGSSLPEQRRCCALLKDGAAAPQQTVGVGALLLWSILLPLGAVVALGMLEARGFLSVSRNPGRLYSDRLCGLAWAHAASSLVTFFVKFHVGVQVLRVVVAVVVLLLPLLLLLLLTLVHTAAELRGTADLGAAGDGAGALAGEECCEFLK